MVRSRTVLAAETPEFYAKLEGRILRNFWQHLELSQMGQPTDTDDIIKAKGYVI